MANYAVILKIGFKLPEYFLSPVFLQSFARRKKSLNFNPNWLGGKYTSIFLHFGGGKIVENRSMGKNYLKLSPQNLFNSFGFFVIWLIWTKNFRLRRIVATTSAF